MRRLDQRGVVFPSPVMILSIIAALGILVYAAILPFVPVGTVTQDE